MVLLRVSVPLKIKSTRSQQSVTSRVKILSLYDEREIVKRKVMKKTSKNISQLSIKRILMRRKISNINLVIKCIEIEFETFDIIFSLKCCRWRLTINKVLPNSHDYSKNNQFLMHDCEIKNQRYSKLFRTFQNIWNFSEPFKNSQKLWQLLKTYLSFSAKFFNPKALYQLKFVTKSCFMCSTFIWLINLKTFMTNPPQCLLLQNNFLFTIVDCNS